MRGSIDDGAKGMLFWLGIDDDDEVRLIEGMVGDGSPEDSGESLSSIHRNLGRFR